MSRRDTENGRGRGSGSSTGRNRRDGEREADLGQELARDIAMLNRWIDACPPGGMVFFGGAGVSTESGIPDFRSSNGIFVQIEGMTRALKMAPEQIVSRSFFDSNPREFYDFYCSKMLFLNAAPNAAHKRLAHLEAEGVLSCVVTQNIDGLHEAAGSTRVFDLHGSVHRNYCMRCGAFYDARGLLRLHDMAQDGVPVCEKCSGMVKPDVVLYEESLNDEVLTGALDAISRAHMLVVAGTSLVVNPAAGLVRYFQGDHLVIVNLSPTPADAQADLCINAKVGAVLGV